MTHGSGRAPVQPSALPPANSADAAPIRRAEKALPAAVLLAVGYFIAASFSMALTRVDGTIAYCWIATALLMPVLTRLPRSRWLVPLAACAAASVTASSLFGVGALAAVPIAIVLMGEAAIGALLLQRFAADGRYFDDVPHLARFALLIGVMMPVIPAFGGAALGTLRFNMDFWPSWLAWYLVHALGALTYSPVVALLSDDDARRRWAEFDPRRGGRGNLAIISAMMLTVGLAFGQTRLPLFFLPFLPLTLLTLRAGRLGASLGICILAVGGGALTISGLGPATLASDDHAVRELFFQFYLVITVLTVLPMAAELNRRKLLTRRLADSEAMFRLIADSSGDVVLNLDVDGRIRYCSPSIAQFGDFDAAALVGQNSLRLVADDDRIVAAAAHAQALARPNETFVQSYRAKNEKNEPIWVETYTRAIIDADGCITGLVSAARDISQRKRDERRLFDAAHSDAMTGLRNRRHFDERLGKAMRSSSRAALAGCLAIVDIDFFKRVNDGHGHLAGDQVLKAVAARLQPMVRYNDIVARIGGEEFGLVLWGLQPADAGMLCQRLREDVAAQQIKLGQTSISVTVSIGIADLAVHQTLPALFAAADAALYRAKAEGRNCVRLAA